VTRTYYGREAEEWEKPMIIPISHAGLWLVSVSSFGRVNGLIKGISLLQILHKSKPKTEISKHQTSIPK